MSFSQFDILFPSRKNLRSGAEIVSLSLHAQPYLTLQDALGALIAYTLAQRTEGKFIVHLDDTDPDSLQERFPCQIFNQLAWMNMRPNEYLHIGNHGPYIWSERRHIYREVAMYLVEEGWVYHCFCQPHDAARKPLMSPWVMQPHSCHSLSLKQVSDRLVARQPYLLRFRASSRFSPDTNQQDSAHEDFVLLRPDGLPMPYFAHVIDNHFMQVTTQVRRSSTRAMVAQERLLYRALGWTMPQQIFIPDIIDPKSHSVFEEARVDQMQALKYLPEALVNLFTDLIWSHPEKKVIYPYTDFVNNFKDSTRLPDNDLSVDYELLDHIQTWYAMNKL